MFQELQLVAPKVQSVSQELEPNKVEIQKREEPPPPPTTTTTTTPTATTTRTTTTTTTTTTNEYEHHHPCLSFFCPARTYLLSPQKKQLKKNTLFFMLKNVPRLATLFSLSRALRLRARPPASGRSLAGPIPGWCSPHPAGLRGAPVAWSGVDQVSYRLTCCDIHTIVIYSTTYMYINM